MRKIMALVLLVLVLLTGCTVGGSDDAASPPPASSPCAEACSGREVDETGCSLGAVSVTGYVPVVAGQAKGQLMLRKARPAVCTRIYWARFTPLPSNTAPFEITISVGDKDFKPQVSEKGVPTLEAWTVGVYAEVGDVVRMCLRSAGQRDCADYTVTS
jgi:hypothetical protein